MNTDTDLRADRLIDDLTTAWQTPAALTAQGSAAADVHDFCAGGDGFAAFCGLLSALLRHDAAQAIKLAHLIVFALAEQQETGRHDPIVVDRPPQPRLRLPESAALYGAADLHPRLPAMLDRDRFELQR